MMRSENWTPTAAATDNYAAAGVTPTRGFSNGVREMANGCSSSSSPGVNYIEHRVSKMDTLAGVAIKYGVEVADIKRLNGLVTDLQMFAHKYLQIPLPGRHPPSPLLANGSTRNGEQTPPYHHHSDVLNSFQYLTLKSRPRKVSPAMSSLRGYYGLTPEKEPASEGTEMAVYRTGRILSLDDEQVPSYAPFSEPLPGRHRNTRSLVNGFKPENGKLGESNAFFDAGENGESEKLNGETSVRRRQKSDSETAPTPELLLKEDYNNGGFSGRTGKGLALRPKSGSRTDIDVGGKAATTGISFIADGLFYVRKSSSTSNLQESDGATSIWPSTKRPLKTDVIARPIFDGLPKPITVRRKAALD